MKLLLNIFDTRIHLMDKICDIFDLLSGLQMSCVFQISCILGFNLNNKYLLRKPQWLYKYMYKKQSSFFFSMSNQVFIFHTLYAFVVKFHILNWLFSFSITSA